MTKKKEEMAKTISKKIYYKSPSSSMIKEVSVNRESKTYFSYLDSYGCELFTVPKCCVLDDIEGRLAYLAQELYKLQNRVHMYEHKHTLLGQKI